MSNRFGLIASEIVGVKNPCPVCGKPLWTLDLKRGMNFYWCSKCNTYRPVKLNKEKSVERRKS